MARSRRVLLEPVLGTGMGQGQTAAVCCGPRGDGMAGAHLHPPGMDAVPPVLNFGPWVMMRLLQMLTHLAAGHSP